MIETHLIADLQLKLRTAIPASYNSLNRRFGDLYGYAVCTTYFVEGLFPICQRVSDLPNPNADRYHFVKYCLS
jgi:hypothetical protein